MNTTILDHFFTPQGFGIELSVTDDAKTFFITCYTPEPNCQIHWDEEFQDGQIARKKFDAEYKAHS